MQLNIEELEKEREFILRLELDVKKRLDGMLHGDYLGLIPGQGSELGETRKYQPGDDPRRIDWNVTARLTDPHIRETIADRELTTWLIVDSSPRSQLGTAKYEKHDLILAGCATIGFLTSGSGNRIGAHIVSGDTDQIIPPKSSRKHLLQILHTIINSKPEDGAGVTNLEKAITKVGTIAKQRSLIVVISDFIVEENWQYAINAAAQKHEVLAIQTKDAADSTLPNVGPILLRDPATGEVVEVDTHKKEIRNKFAEAARLRQDKLSNALLSSGVDHLILSTDSDWVTDVFQFISTRKAKMSSRKRNL